jgi:hypothetical protein
MYTLGLITGVERGAFRNEALDSIFNFFVMPTMTMVWSLVLGKCVDFFPRRTVALITRCAIFGLIVSGVRVSFWHFNRFRKNVAARKFIADYDTNALEVGDPRLESYVVGAPGFSQASVAPFSIHNWMGLDDLRRQMSPDINWHSALTAFVAYGIAKIQPCLVKLSLSNELPVPLNSFVNRDVDMTLSAVNDPDSLIMLSLVSRGRMEAVGLSEQNEDAVDYEQHLEDIMEEADDYDGMVIARQIARDHAQSVHDEATLPELPVSTRRMPRSFYRGMPERANWLQIKGFACATECHNKFGPRDMTDDNLLVSRKWLYDFIKSEYPQLKGPSFSIVMEIALPMSFLPNQVHFEMRDLMTTGAYASRMRGAPTWQFWNRAPARNRARH